MELQYGSGSSLDDRRRRMTLDLAASQRKCFYPSSTSTHVASPDLEAFLLYASSSGSELDWTDNTTSTPTQILFPNSVTAEQEAYARGFVDALEELHRRQGVPAVAQSVAQSTVWTQQSSSSSSCSATAVVSGWSSTSGPVSSSCRGVVSSLRRGRQSAVDDGVQLVPRLSCLTPPSSPDVDTVEVARIDRKRERNRLAAQKCRSRKLEQIAVLESRCAVLRAENDSLSRTAGQLADEVARLRQTLVQHTSGSQCLINDTRAAQYTLTSTGSSSRWVSLSCPRSITTATCLSVLEPRTAFCVFHYTTLLTDTRCMLIVTSRWSSTLPCSTSLIQLHFCQSEGYTP